MVTVKLPQLDEERGRHGPSTPWANRIQSPFARLCKVLKLSTETDVNRVLDEAALEIETLRDLPSNEELAAMKAKMLADQRRLQKIEADQQKARDKAAGKR